jgi:integrase
MLAFDPPLLGIDSRLFAYTVSIAITDKILKLSIWPGMLLQRQKNRVEELTSTLFVLGNIRIETTLAARAGLKVIRLHDARHTHASLMLNQGVHPKIVQERLGHASIQITLDTYSHAAPGLQEAAAESFDKLVSPKYNGEAEPVEEHY